MLLGCALVGLAWFIALLIFGAGGVGSGIPGLFTNLWLLPWAALITVAGLVGGWLTARVCTRSVREASERETVAVRADIGQRLTRVAYDLVVAPAELELSEFSRFRAQLRAARDDLLRESGHVSIMRAGAGDLGMREVRAGRKRSRNLGPPG